MIALGRLMLAALFLLTIWMDPSQPTRAHIETYALLVAYVLFSAAIAKLTWSDWWLDARLAGPAHATDIAMFTLLVLATEGYTSPYFTFVMFVLLSAAIRWGWRATALTAVLAILLFIAVGLSVIDAQHPFDLQRFVIRTGHLVILSLILIWFGINPWRAGGSGRSTHSAIAAVDEPPLDLALRSAMAMLQARSGTVLWCDHGSEDCTALTLAGDRFRAMRVPPPVSRHQDWTTFLYDVRRNRALVRGERRDLLFRAADELIDGETAERLGLTEGVAIRVTSDSGRGTLFLEEVRALSNDHIHLGEQVAVEITAQLQRHELLRTAEESAEARSRLSLARDLHDSVVQFLAGAAFRLEAMKRSVANGRDVGDDLDELKQLMLYEQGELRAFIDALRSGAQIALSQLARDLKGLAERLSRQWDVHCSVDADAGDTMLPTRLHLDAHQLMREAVANAVRHAGAQTVTARLETDADALRLEFLNDGAAYPRNGATLPRSLQERVEQAGGEIELSRGMGVTRLAITLPIPGRNQ